MPPLKREGYYYEGLIATGHASAIYKMVSKETEQPFAVKVVKRGKQDSRNIDATINEHEVAVLCAGHPNICQAHDLELEKKWMKITEARYWMEYIEGHRLDQVTDLPGWILADLFRQTAVGLAHLHSKGVIHADIKPQNIMIQNHETAKVIDFGYSHIKKKPMRRVMGTLDYMAPEQTTSRTVNVKTDIYNLGATMYHILCGKVLPSTTNRGNLSAGYIPIPAEGVASEVPNVRTYRRDVIENFDKLVMQCCHRDPALRPPTMEHVARELKMVCAEIESRDRTSHRS